MTAFEQSLQPLLCTADCLLSVRNWFLQACAHRYKKSGPAYVWGTGLCITMNNALDEDSYWEPCDWLPKFKGHSEYGFCQAGTSAAMDQVGFKRQSAKALLHSTAHTLHTAVFLFHRDLILHTLLKSILLTCIVPVMPSRPKGVTSITSYFAA